jgi:inner membrane protein
MDNLTHTLAGALLGEAGLKRRSGLAMPTLLIGANLPDLDALALVFGNETALAFRRGWTHGALALLVLPLLLTLAMLAWDRWSRHRRTRVRERPVEPAALLLIAFVAVCSHPLLDWLNTYGMRWLMPFDGTWFYGDALFIVDPWVLAALLMGIGVARYRGRPRAAQGAAGFIAIYVAVMIGTATAGRRMVAEAVRARGIAAEEVMVGPVAFDPNRRQVIIREGRRYHTGTLRWLPRPRLVVDDGTVESNLRHPLAGLVQGHPEVQRFLSWSRFPYATIEEQPDAYAVRIDDLRYAGRYRKSWAAVELEIPKRPPARVPTVTAFDTAPAVRP